MPDWTDEEVQAGFKQGWTTKASGERQEFASGMKRDVTDGKTKWHLIFSGPMLERWAELMTRGAEKYDDDNWMKADSDVELNRFKQSAFRHFMQWYRGDTDEDHAAAVIFNINGKEYVEDVMADKLPLAAQYESYNIVQDKVMQGWVEFYQANEADYGFTLHDCPNCGGHDD